MENHEKKNVLQTTMVDMAIYNVMTVTFYTYPQDIFIYNRNKILVTTL